MFVSIRPQRQLRLWLTLCCEKSASLSPMLYIVFVHGVFDTNMYGSWNLSDYLANGVDMKIEAPWFELGVPHGPNLQRKTVKLQVVDAISWMQELLSFVHLSALNQLPLHVSIGSWNCLYVSCRMRFKWGASLKNQLLILTFQTPEIYLLVGEYVEDLYTHYKKIVMAWFQ